MNRKIAWDSGALDEISLVYDKAEENDAIGTNLEKLEEQALAEGGSASALLRKSGQSVKDFASLTPSEKEKVIAALGTLGLSELKADIASATIQVTFAPALPLVQACTIFNLLNRLEKLDGSFNILVSDKATLLLRVPLGGAKGLSQWKMLILQLYPWLSVHEESTDQMAVGLTDAGVPAGSPAAAAKENVTQNKVNTSAGSQKGIVPAELYRRMIGKTAFSKALSMAKSEVEATLRSTPFAIKANGKPLTVEDWRKIPEQTQLGLILALANREVSVQRVIYVKNCEKNPCCIALALLAAAESGQIEKQEINAGDAANYKPFVEALTLLSSCCDRWECRLIKPVSVTIGANASEPEASQPAKKAEEPAKPEKKSFWKRLFGK